MRDSFLSYLRTFGVLFFVFSSFLCLHGAWRRFDVPDNSVPAMTALLLNPYLAMMPLLTFSSGYLFNLMFSKYKSYAMLIENKAQRLIIPVLVFGELYSLVVNTTVNFDQNYINKLLSGYYILWYCNMLFWCFVIA